MKRSAVYLDYNATAPLLSEVSLAMEPFWHEPSANPSSIHEAGAHAAQTVRQARREAAAFLDAQEESEIVFTSGGTEGNNTVLRSALWTHGGRRRVVTTAVEHSSLLKPAQALQEEGVEVTYLPVTAEGELEKEKLNEALRKDAALVSVMMANNETGVRFPIEEIGKRVQEAGILFHVDAVQAAGKVPVSLRSLPVDFASFSAHKFGGPMGIGVLYVRKGTPFRPLLFGGSQEKGRRAGTENVAGIIGLGAACRKLREILPQMMDRMQRLRDSFEEKVFNAIAGVQINGCRDKRIPNTSNLAFEGVDSETLLILLDQEGIYASAGSACISGASEPSHVLKAMGFSEPRINSSVRFSFGTANTSEEVDRVVEALKRFVGQLRRA